MESEEKIFRIISEKDNRYLPKSYSRSLFDSLKMYIKINRVITDIRKQYCTEQEKCHIHMISNTLFYEMSEKNYLSL